MENLKHWKNANKFSLLNNENCASPLQEQIHSPFYFFTPTDFSKQLLIFTEARVTFLIALFVLISDLTDVGNSVAGVKVYNLAYIFNYYKRQFDVLLHIYYVDN